MLEAEKKEATNGVRGERRLVVVVDDEQEPLAAVVDVVLDGQSKVSSKFLSSTNSDERDH